MKKIPHIVLILGLVSFFTDVSSEMIYPLLPVFLSASLGASTFQLGLIEGVAEATAAILKIFSGVWADRVHKKKPLILGGYFTSGTMRPLIGLSTSWPGVLVIRFCDRVGKGIRSSPRDAMIADVSNDSNRGVNYGFHQAMDHAGAVTGPIIASLLLMIPGMKMRNVFLWAGVPALITMIILIFFLKEREAKKELADGKKSFHLIKDWHKLSTEFKFFLGILFLFTLGNSTDAFLLVRLNKVGIPPSWIAFLWSIFHVVKMSSSYFGGLVSDKIGRKWTISFGWIFYGIIYLAFAFVQNKFALMGIFIAYGIYYLNEPVEKAFVADIAPKNMRGTSFGYFNFIVGIGALPASLLFGLMWDTFSAQAAFFLGAGLALFATALLFFMPVQKGKATF